MLTSDEILVAQKRNLPVIITHNAEQYEPGNYNVNAIIRFIPRADKHYIYSAQICQRQKILYTLPIDDLSPAPGYENIFAESVKTIRRQQLKGVIKNYLAAGYNKTTLGKLIREIIDGIRAEESVAKQNSEAA
mgnify:FL=1